MRKVNGRRTTSDGKSSHCLWYIYNIIGELKCIFVKMTIKNKYKRCKMKTYLWLVLCILFPEQWMHKVILNIEVIQFKS